MAKWWWFRIGSSDRWVVDMAGSKQTAGRRAKNRVAEQRRGTSVVLLVGRGRRGGRWWCCGAGGAAGSAGRKYRGGKRMIMVWGEKSECDCACLCLAYERIAKVTKKIYV